MLLAVRSACTIWPRRAGHILKTVLVRSNLIVLRWYNGSRLATLLNGIEVPEAPEGHNQMKALLLLFHLVMAWASGTSMPLSSIANRDPLTNVGTKAGLGGLLRISKQLHAFRRSAWLHEPSSAGLMEGLTVSHLPGVLKWI